VENEKEEKGKRVEEELNLGELNGTAARSSGSSSVRGPAFRDLILAGPAPAPLLRAETYFRYQIMLRTRQMTRLSQHLARLFENLGLPEDVTLSVDIDPVNLI
jgi:primosomal protein N' (replication factor Y)